MDDFQNLLNEELKDPQFKQERENIFLDIEQVHPNDPDYKLMQEARVSSEASYTIEEVEKMLNLHYIQEKKSKKTNPLS